MYNIRILANDNIIQTTAATSGIVLIQHRILSIA